MINPIIGKKPKDLFILTLLNLIVVGIIEFSKTSEYGVALFLTLILFTFWSFSGQRTDNPKQLLLEWWETLKLSADLSLIIAITLIVTFVSVLILAHDSASDPAFRYEEWTQKKDQVVSLILAIGLISLVAYSLMKKRKDMLGYWSKNITMLNSFMVVGNSFAITPILETIVKLAPLLLISFILANAILVKVDLLRNMIGLMILGLMISQAIGVGLGWTGTSEQFKSSITNTTSALELVVMNEPKILLFVREPMPEYYERFIKEKIDDKNQIIGVNQSNIDKLKNRFNDAVDEVQGRTEKITTNLDIALDESNKAEQESYGISRMFYHYFYTILLHEKLDIESTNQYVIAYFLFAKAVSTDDTTSISQANQSIQTSLKLSERLYELKKEIGIKASYDTPMLDPRLPDFEKLYYSILITESIKSDIAFIHMNESYWKLLLSINTTVPLLFVSDEFTLIPENVCVERMGIPLMENFTTKGTKTAMVEFECKYKNLRDNQLNIWWNIDALVEPEPGQEFRHFVEIRVPLRKKVQNITKLSDVPAVNY